MDNPVLVAVIPLIRRFIRGTLPALFVMVILFLIPVVFDGPRVMEWYEDYKSQFDNDWLAVLLQIRNYNSGQYVRVCRKLTSLSLTHIDMHSDS